jgi:predicted CopG family antitoxin
MGVKKIDIEQELYAFLLSRAQTPGESPSDILRRELRLPPPVQTIDVDDDVYNYLASHAAVIGESASDILRRELPVGDEHGDGDDAGVIEFHIPAGTGSKPWNTRETMLVGTVGGTLRLVNDDSMPHRLHTSGAPFPHMSADIAAGETRDVTLKSAFEPTATSVLYDHNAGPAAEFWLRVRAAG